MPLPLAAVPLIAQGAVGLGQLMGGIATKTGKRPQYQAPQALQDSYRQATSEANATGDPMMAAAQDRIRQNTANTIGAAQKSTRSSGSLLNAVGNAQVAENAGMNNLSMQGMGLREQRRARRYQVAGQMAQAQDKAFEINQMQPYMDKMNAKRGLMGAGLQNIMGGMSDYAAVKLQDNYLNGGQAQADFGAMVERNRGDNRTTFRGLGVDNAANYNNANQYGGYS
jgi:hypothetical protein